MACAVFMVVVGVAGSGDNWLGFVVAAGAVAMAYAVYGSQTVVISRAGVRRALPWSRSIRWAEVAGLEFSEDHCLRAALRAGGRSPLLAIFPTFFFDDRQYVDRRKSEVLNEVAAAAERHGWSAAGQ